MTRPPADQAVRDRVIRDFDTTFLLEAGAGTGKTTVLVNCILALVRTGRATLDRIVAILLPRPAKTSLPGRRHRRLRDRQPRAPARRQGHHGPPGRQ